ncbi:replication-relaxation family protein [Nocardioides humi]|uniref:Replication-relaxation family protein n=1 Tax=Nocardioides humi TaxID=449461 RepID=A0ABN2A091_9ACTN|nr:replication-relaxation family protein [Nocardioides humi]
MTGPKLLELAEQLSERDQRVLGSLEEFRLLDTRQLQRLHFADHATPLAAARATARAMQRLEGLGLVAALERRIGGVRRGSASYIWQLAATGERYLRTLHRHADQQSGQWGSRRRRRYMEPGVTFVNHTLAVNDVAVGLLEASRDVASFAVEELVPEPRNWRSFLGPGGETRWLKPDLTAVAIMADEEGEYEEHAFLEIDLGTEHLPRIQAKCRVYADYAATGAYQAEHGLFPAVVWLSPSPARRAALSAAVATTPGLDRPAEVFRVTSPEEYLASIRQTPSTGARTDAGVDASTGAGTGADAGATVDNPTGGQKGGTP